MWPPHASKGVAMSAVKVMLICRSSPPAYVTYWTFVMVPPHIVKLPGRCTIGRPVLGLILLVTVTVSIGTGHVDGVPGLVRTPTVASAFDSVALKVPR